jgi:hypothetical protein
MRWLLALSFVFLAATAHAERATERYAPAQISVAQDLLERARAAAALEDHNAAAAYAQQAEVDARIAWGMTDASGLRAQAAEVAAGAEAILHPPQRLSATSSPSASLR